MRVKILFVLFIIFITPVMLFAQIPYRKADNIYPANAPDIVSRSAVLVDAETGTVLFFKNPNDPIPPASLTKLMTMHIVMTAIKEGKTNMNEFVPITRESWALSQPPRSSLMFLAPGQYVTVREILTGLAVVSGNDAAVAAALHIAPSMKDFAEMMNAEARRMGLTSTRFVESSGISSSNITTAYEFASFCYHYLKLHPNSISDFHSVREMSFPLAENVRERYRSSVQTILQYNRNNLLRSYEGVDGLKTGFIDESGFNIALTARRNYTRFILVILGGPNEQGGAGMRDRDCETVLTWAFEKFQTVYPELNSLIKYQMEFVKIWKGKNKTVALEIKKDEMLNFTSYLNRADEMKYEVVIPRKLIAPISKGTEVGYLLIYDDIGPLKKIPLVTKTECVKGNIFKRIWHSFLLLFQ